MKTLYSRLSAAPAAILRGLACAFVFVVVFAAVHRPGPPADPAPPELTPLRAHAAVVSTAPEQAKPNGEKLYLTRCMSCHQANGQGIPGTFPPIDGSEWVTGDKGRIVRVVLHGLSGEIMVGGAKYNGAMPGWGSFMNDAEVAALITYTRQAWGNDADEVTAAEVKAVRAAHADRKQPWTAAEFEKPQNLGIPGQSSAGSK